MDLIVETLRERSKWLHQMLREEVRDLTPEQLDFVPVEGANSIAVLVVHTLGAQAELWSMVAGSRFDRDRPAEFVTKGLSAGDLIARIDAVDRLLDELAPQIDGEKLAAVWRRPNGQANTGAYWLINQLSHAREHLGHLQLTKQLFPDRFPPLAHPY